MKINVEVAPTDKYGEWSVVKEFSYLNIHIDSGQLTDGASIPWIMSWLFKKGGPVFAPAVIHDTAYRTGCVNRKLADDIFLKAMFENEVTLWKAKSMYLGVRFFGWIAWKKNRKLQEEIEQDWKKLDAYFEKVVKDKEEVSS